MARTNRALALAIPLAVAAVASTGHAAECFGNSVEIRCCNSNGEWVRSTQCVKQHILNGITSSPCPTLLCPPGQHLFYLVEFSCAPCAGGFAWIRPLVAECDHDCNDSGYWKDYCWTIAPCWAVGCDPYTWQGGCV